MNKGYLNGILIVFLIAIWGSVIYKYFVKKTVVIPENKVHRAINSNMDHTIAKDTFTLTLNDRDPFRASKENKRRAKKQLHPKTKGAGKKRKSIKSLVWPRIEYYGFVKREQNKTKKAFIKVNGKVHRKREREMIDELKIVNIYGDSIIVSLNNDNKTIKRK